MSTNDLDKKNLEDIASELLILGFNLIATKGTAAYLLDFGIKVKEVLKVKDEVIDTSTGKFKLPTQEELDTAASEFKSKSVEAGILSRDQVTFATDTIKGFDLGGAERLLKTAQNNDLLSSLNTVIDDIDKNRAKLINNGYSFDEATQSWSKK